MDLTPTAEVTDGEGKDAANDKDLLVEAKERYKLAEDAWAENRKAALDDTRFRNLDQWPEKVKAAREKAGRPCLVVDKGNQYVRQVVNDGRQNRPAIKIRPVDDEAHIDGAEAFQDIIRSICNRSNADAAYDTALDHAATGGFGFFRLTTKYVHEKTFNQDICIKRIRNPQAVLLDPNIQEADGSDANWGFVIDEMPKKEFKRQYPKAKFTDWEADSVKYSEGWITGENVRTCEYFYKVETPTDLHLLEDGSSVEDDEYQRAVKELGQDKVPAIIETRSIPTCKVKWCRLSGAEVLEKNDWLGKYIPIIPVFGNELDVDGKVVYSGLIRAAKDAMRLYNYSRSAYAERVALTPKAPFVAAAGQVEGHPEWQDANTENYSVLAYDPVDVNGTALPPPQRQMASDIPEGFARDMQLSEHDIQSSMGMFAASLGQSSNEKSGKAINARVRESDTGTFHYQDNLNRAICYLGVQLVDLIPKVIDSPRAIQLMGEDGVSSVARIDPTQQQPVRKEGALAIYNLNIGTYGVTVSTGPSYTTKRQEASEGMIALTQANPTMWQTHGDLIVKAQDWPNADEFAKRSVLTLPPPIQQAIQQEEGGEGLPPEILQAQQQIQQGQQELQQAHQQITQMAQELSQEKAATDAEKAKLDAARQELQSQQKLLQSKYEELSAKLELQAMQAGQVVPGAMPSGMSEPAINPSAELPHPQQSGQPAAPHPHVVLAAAMDGMSQAISQMGKPKTVVRDAQGRVQGIQ